MAENQESPTSIIENLALITDAMQTVFPNGKMICVYELEEEDFKNVQQLFRKIDHHHNKFSVDISGLEHVFINTSAPDEVVNETKEEPKTEETNKKSSWFKRS